MERRIAANPKETKEIFFVNRRRDPPIFAIPLTNAPDGN
jgi:hypothetical protein